MPASSLSWMLLFGVVLCLQSLWHTHTSMQLRQEIAELRMMVMKKTLSGDAYVPPFPPNIINEIVGVPDVSDAAAKGTQIDGKWVMYGGTEVAHLGGWTQNDTDGQSLVLWQWMVKGLNVRSFLDIGCGRGISTRWFLEHRNRVLCVEGSLGGITNSLLPRELIVQHDYSKGPWWPEETFDVAWGVEFLEHVGRQHAQNYWPTFKRAALVFVTWSRWGGHHHVEVHNDWWWKARMAAQGFVFSPELTRMVKGLARRTYGGLRASHLVEMHVFINPPIAQLPQHAHLVGNVGCFGKGPCGDRVPCACTGADTLPEQFRPVWNETSPLDPIIEEMEHHIGWRLRDLTTQDMKTIQSQVQKGTNFTV